jgi:demethylmenaquinone methyltransferase/2-methoxy-6-polyprenyl-1,4-benzoquinol methylase
MGIYSLWNRTLVRRINREVPIHDLLDLCAGTGEIALAHLKKSKTPCRAILLDFCAPMLEVAKAKASQLQLPGHSLEFIQGDAQLLPLPDASVDAVTIAYGIRNVADPSRCVKEVMRVLKPGGCWGILELTRPKNALLNTLHTAYLRTMLPILGKIAASNKGAYEYLSSSIGKFQSPEELKSLLAKSGFETVQCYPQTGGIATILIAKKSK